MIEDDIVVFEARLNGEDVAITVGDVLNHPRAADMIGTGVKRKIDSAATNKADDETAEGAKLLRAQDILSRREWSRGGGNAISDRERHRRDVLAQYASLKAGLTRSEAERQARKDFDSLLATTAGAIVKAQDGKKPDKARLEAACDKFRQRIEAEVQKRLDVEEIDI